MLSSVLTGGQRGGGAGAVWIRRRPVSEPRPGPEGTLEDGESRPASPPAVCLPALPGVKRRLPPSAQRAATAAARQSPGR